MASLDTKVVVKGARLSYVHLFDPWAQDEDQDEKYSCVLLIPKEDKETLDRLKKAQQNALENGKEKAFGGKIPSDWKSTLRDGDERDDLEDNPAYVGHMYMSVSSNQRPGVVDRNLDPIMDKAAVYSGCYANVSLNAYAYNTKGNKGVTFFLRNVQFLKDGEPLGNVSRPQDDFDVVDDEGLI